MFCVECGKETEIYKEGVCIDCYINSHEFTKGKENIKLPMCPHCGGFKYKNTWTNEILTDVLRRIIKNTFKIKNELKKIDINPVCKETTKGYDCIVYISGLIGDKEITEEHKLSVKLEKTSCDVCSKQFGGYHEAIIQIRTDSRKLSNIEKEDIINSVIDQVEELKSKGNRALFISDIAKEHGGVNFFISDKQTAYSITKKLKEKYGGEIKKSSKNIGMKDSKQINRMTYLLRLPDYKTKDFIKYDNNYYKIISIHSNKIKLLNLSNWNEHTIEQKNLENIEKIKKKITKKEMIVVSQTEKEIQLMDTNTYKTININKPTEENIKSNKTFVIFIEDNCFLFNENNT